MYTATYKAISAYQRIDIETGIEAANPHKLILMLFDGAHEALAKAKQHIQRNEISEKGKMLSKAIMIIDHGLKASLDMRVGGDLAIKLQALYDYMTHRLLIANIQNNTEIINEVDHLLLELHAAWQQIGHPNEDQAEIKTVII